MVCYYGWLFLMESSAEHMGRWRQDKDINLPQSELRGMGQRDDNNYFGIGAFQFKFIENLAINFWDLK